MDLTPNAQERLAFITPQGRVFKWKVMPFGVANATALFQELMNKILSILCRRPVVQELISRGAQMEAHIDDVCLGTNTQEGHLILLGEFFAVCQESHTRLKRVRMHAGDYAVPGVRHWLWVVDPCGL